MVRSIVVLALLAACPPPTMPADAAGAMDATASTCPHDAAPGIFAYAVNTLAADNVPRQQRTLSLAPIDVQRAGLGLYDVHVPGMDNRCGAVLLTAHSVAAGAFEDFAACVVHDRTHAPDRVVVACVSTAPGAAGQRVDAAFEFLYVR